MDRSTVERDVTRHLGQGREPGRPNYVPVALGATRDAFSDVSRSGLFLRKPHPRGGTRPIAVPRRATASTGATDGRLGRSGKSLLFEVFATQLRRSGRAVAKVSLLGISPAEMLWQLIVGLGRATEASDSIGLLWQSLTDRLTENRYQQLDTVLLLDDADHAEPAVLAQVTRLVRHDRSPDSRSDHRFGRSPGADGPLGRRVARSGRTPDRRRDVESGATRSVTSRSRWPEPAAMRRFLPTRRSLDSSN